MAKKQPVKAVKKSVKKSEKSPVVSEPKPVTKEYLIYDSLYDQGYIYWAVSEDDAIARYVDSTDAENRELSVIEKSRMTRFVLKNEYTIKKCE